MIVIGLILIVMMLVMLGKLSRISNDIDAHTREQGRLSRNLAALKEPVEKILVCMRPAAEERKDFKTSELSAITELTAPKKDIKFDAVPGSLADISKKQEPPELLHMPPEVKGYMKEPVPGQVLSKEEAKPSYDEKVSTQATDKKRSAFIESASEIIKKIWSWILVGEEYRPKGVTMEYAVASTWLLRLGIVAIVTCIGYFLNWSIQQGLINDAGRVAISIITGIVMLGFGWRILGGKYRLLGLGLMGGGLAALYFGVYAAVGLYKLVPVPVGFALAVVITVAAGILAVYTDSLLLAILGIIGGYFSPVMLRTGVPNFMGLYSYMLLLGIGVLVIAHYKPWRLLNYLSFLFTYFLLWVSLSQYHTSDFPVVITFLSLFFVVQASIGYIYNISRGNKSTVLEIMHQLLNAAFYSTTAYYLIMDAYGRPYPSIMSVSLAVFYILHVILFLRKKLIDRNLLVSLIALAGFYTIWTMPLIMSKEALTLSWALEAFMFLWLAYKLDSNFLKQIAYIVYVLVFCRLLFLDMPDNFDWHPAIGKSMSVYWREMIQRLWNFGISTGSVIGAFFLHKKGLKSETALNVSEKNDTPQIVNKNIASNVLYWFSVLFVFLFVYLELNTMFLYYLPLRLPVLTVLWCAMAVYFLYMLLQSEGQSNVMFNMMSIFIVGAIIKIFVIDLMSWNFCGSFLYQRHYCLYDAGLRLVDFGAICVLLFTVCWFLSHITLRQKSVPRFGTLGLILLFVYMTLEFNTFFYWRLSGFRAGGISILWALFAIGFIIGGIWKNITALRYSGLCLFAVVVGKVFLVDLGHLAIIYRVIAFLVVGVFLLLGAFSYMYASKKFARKNN